MFSINDSMFVTYSSGVIDKIVPGSISKDICGLKYNYYDNLVQENSHDPVSKIIINDTRHMLEILAHDSRDLNNDAVVKKLITDICASSKR